MDYMINAEDIVIQVYARGNIKSDTLIVFLHGGPGSGAKALMELPAFHALEMNYQCVYFDQRGSQKTLYDLKKGLRKEQICNDVHAVIKDCRERFSFKKLVLWGGSFGGVLALLFTEKFSDFDALILSSPAICFGRQQSLQLFQRTKAISEGKLSNTCIIENNTEGRNPEEELCDKNFQEFVFSKNNPSNSLRHIAAMSSWFFHFDASDCIKSINKNTLLMIGKEDPICDSRAILSNIDKIKNQKVNVYEFSPCGHAVFEDCLQEFVTKITHFIDAL